MLWDYLCLFLTSKEGSYHFVFNRNVNSFVGQFVTRLDRFEPSRLIAERIRPLSTSKLWCQLSFIRCRSTTFKVVTLLVNFLVPFVTTVVAHAKMFFVVRHHIRTVSASSSSSSSSPSGFFYRSVRSARNIFIICAAYWLTYFPVILSTAIDASIRISERVGYALVWIYMTSAVVNGLLYITLHSAVRRDLRRRLRSICGCCDSATCCWSAPSGRTEITSRDGGEMTQMGCKSKASQTQSMVATVEKTPSTQLKTST